MYQKLLKNIQARINSKENKNKVNMKGSDDGSSDSTMNNNKNSSNNTSSKSMTNKPRNHSMNNSSMTNNNNIKNLNNDNEDEKEEYSIEDLLNAETVSLREVQNADDRKALFIKKLKLCCIIFDFTVGDPDQNHQLAKETHLFTRIS